MYGLKLIKGDFGTITGVFQGKLKGGHHAV
jgi:hypothetical protein